MEMTASRSTSQKSAIFSLTSSGIGAVGAGDDDVGLDAERAQLAHALLGRFRLQLAAADLRHQRDVDVEGVLAADLAPQLADRLDEGLALDVADRAADLDDDDVGVMLARGEPHAVLDLVGDVRDDLDGAAEVVAAAFLGDDRGVDLTGGDVGGAGEVLVGEALVVAEVEVGLRAVVGDEDLAVLVRGHRAGVDVEVGIELHGRDTGAPALEHPPDRGGRDALADR